MLSIVATVISILNGLFNLCKGLFGKSSQPVDGTANAVATENKIGATAAQVSRDTAQQVNEDIQNATTDESAGAADVRDADSVRDQQSAINDAIDRANASAGPDN
jgi:hypothetical protein